VRWPGVMSRLSALRSWCAHAFAVQGEDEPLSARERALVERLAVLVVRRRMVVPTIVLLECARPLSFLGSQLLQFVKPFATVVFDADEYESLARLLERREAVDLLMAAVDERERTKDE